MADSLLLVVGLYANDCLQIFRLLLMFWYRRLQRRNLLQLHHQRTVTTRPLY